MDNLLNVDIVGVFRSKFSKHFINFNQLQGPTMPALMIVLARWVPPHERSRQGAVVFGGAQIGNIFGSFMSGVLLADNRDWAYVFYFFGCFGILWFLFWVGIYILNNILGPLRLS